MYNVIQTILLLVILFYNLHVVLSYANDYIYQLRRRIVRSLALQVVIVLVVVRKLILALNMGTTLDQFIALCLLAAAIFSLIASASHGEGINEKGFFAFLSFTPWEEIESYEWKPHFSEKNSYLVIKLRHNNNVQERYTVIPNENKEVIDQYFKKYIGTSV